ncbi:MAG: lysophospholipid acyltransferase family protein [Bacteriovoracaceae bacterium]|nr:hypothetical protein [Halobacteriovoraceae bacterium]MDP7319787.1 lysophospholipid acyltransferase family protein [Bacteriovoracaceae bacterium]
MIAFLRYFLYTFYIFLSLFIVSPLAIIRPFNPANSYMFFKVFAFFMENFGGFKLHVEGAQKVVQTAPGVLIGNHQHNYDVLSVAKIFTRKTVVLGKFELGLIPFFGQIYFLFGNILVKRGNRKKAMKSMAMVEKKVLNNKLVVLVFPEGTRNTKKELKKFKKGAFYTALRTQSPLIPFSVSQFVAYCDFNTFKKIHIYVKVHDPIPTLGLTTQDIPALMEKSKKIIETGISELNQNYQ